MKRYILMADVIVVDGDGEQVPVFIGLLEMSAILDAIILTPCDLNRVPIPGLYAKILRMVAASDGTDGDSPVDSFSPQLN